MNKILRRFFPVDKLPTELQSGLPKHGWVDIEIDASGVPRPDRNGLRIADLVGTGRNVHGDLDSILGHSHFLREDR